MTREEKSSSWKPVSFIFCRSFSLISWIHSSDLINKSFLTFHNISNCEFWIFRIFGFHVEHIWNNRNFDYCFRSQSHQFYSVRIFNKCYVIRIPTEKHQIIQMRIKRIQLNTQIGNRFGFVMRILDFLTINGEWMKIKCKLISNVIFRF